VIGDNVWIGESVMILPGVKIGRGSVIGAGSVVTKSIPEFSIAVGNPAKVVKTFSADTNTWQTSSST
jgi:lipopolysaccharide O-acetyltransferase